MYHITSVEEAVPKNGPFVEAIENGEDDVIQAAHINEADRGQRPPRTFTKLPLEGVGSAQFLREMAIA